MTIILLLLILVVLLVLLMATIFPEATKYILLACMMGVIAVIINVVLKLGGQ